MATFKIVYELAILAWVFEILDCWQFLAAILNATQKPATLVHEI